MSYIGKSKSEMKTVAKALNDLLCTYFVYFQNLRAFHWNVEGPNFFELHNLFEELYNDAKLKIDEIAERVLMFSYAPSSQLSTYLKRSAIKEADFKVNDEIMIQTVLANQTQLIEQMRKVISAAGKAKDEGTVHLIGSMLFETEKRTWMLSSWLRRV